MNNHRYHVETVQSICLFTVPRMHTFVSVFASAAGASIADWTFFLDLAKTLLQTGHDTEQFATK
jgi:hypothetical protein